MGRDREGAGHAAVRRRPEQAGSAVGLATLASAETLTERASALVEADIVSGALAPEARLGIAEMAARYGVGATPLREALSRLAARGLVDAIGMRGFRVKAISYNDLADIVRIRTTIEREALRLSMAKAEATGKRAASPPCTDCGTTPNSNRAG